jgi:hypothetical protein
MSTTSQWPACDTSLAKARAAGSTWEYCSLDHCDSNWNQNDDFCNCTGQYDVYPYIQNGICMENPWQVIPQPPSQCFCCCSCFAFDTLIAVSADQEKVIQDLVINDPVLVAEGPDLKNWVQKPIKFSSGTGPKGKNELMKIRFLDATKKMVLTEKSFVSNSPIITKEESGTFYRVLSNSLNKIINKEGHVNAEIVSRMSIEELALTLGISTVIADVVYKVLMTDPNYLIVTSDQPFLMKDGTLKQAGKLVPGTDKLLKKDGSSVPIVSMEVGMFEKGVHHISTHPGPAKSLKDNLMLANGIVVGDYSLQIALTANSSDVPDHYKDEPKFGTTKYVEKHTHLSIDHFSAKSLSSVDNVIPSFTPFSLKNSTAMPEKAMPFFNVSQAEYLKKNAPMYSPGENIGLGDLNYLFKLLEGFFPSIIFYYDVHNIEPNVYSVRQYGREIVVVNQGFLLLQSINFPGLAVVLTQVVNALQVSKGSQLNHSIEGRADYEVSALVMAIFHVYSEGTRQFTNGMAELGQLFDILTPALKEGVPGTYNELGLDCRVKTMNASFNGLPLPHCAGGPPDPAVELLSVTPYVRRNASVIALTFNKSLESETVTALSNYMFSPLLNAVSARLSKKNPKVVKIIVEPEGNVEYTLVVKGILSTDKQPIIPGKNIAKFTFEEIIIPKG